MKFLILGLGNFGSSLAIELTDMGHEVIAIDSDMHKVEKFKNDISSTICMDCDDALAIRTLPIDEIDIAIVCIGRNFGVSIMATSIMKQLNVKKIISRATSQLHEAVLQAIGVDDIVFPEQETAMRLSKRLQINNVFDSYQADETHFILKSYLPKKFNKLTINDINFEKYNITFLSVLRVVEIENIFGEKVKKHFVNKEKLDRNSVLKTDDIIMVYGEKRDLFHFFNL
ncbi:MAG: TrkA family potassium uptake protein [Bacteroidales bacterium]|nr:TrkA family potassium uptake protein [Bacteroidales bacterium]